MSALGQKQTCLGRRASSIHWLRLREFPCAVQDFGARAIEPHHLVPALHDRQAVGNLASQPPNWTATEPSVPLFAVMLFATCMGAPAPNADDAASVVPPSRMLRRSRVPPAFFSGFKVRSIFVRTHAVLAARMTIGTSLPLRRRVKLDFLDRAGKRERTLRPVVRADL
jgi:hypothetical protein